MMLDVSCQLGDIKDIDTKKNERNPVKMRDDFKDYVNSNKDLFSWQQIYLQRTGRVKEGDCTESLIAKTMHSKTSFL